MIVSYLLTTVRLMATVALMVAHSLVATAATPTGLTATPTQTQLQISTDQPTADLTVRYTNHLTVPATLDLQAVDFSEANDDGQVSFVGKNPTDFSRQHGLATWLHLDKSSISINPGQTAAAQVSVTDNSALSPGGHYAAVLATLKQAESASQPVGAKPGLATLIFANKTDGAVYKMQLNKLQPQRSWWGGVTEASLEFDNGGNVHVVPRGIVQLVGPFGQVLGRGIINSQSALLLPGQQRSLTVPMAQLGLPLWPGPYRVASQYRYEGGNHLDTTIKSYFFPGIVLPVAGGLAVIGVLGWFLFRHRRNSRTNRGLDF